MPWSEVVHDSPVPALPPEELRAVRERFLGDDDGLLERRDARLAAAIAASEPLMLWVRGGPLRRRASAPDPLERLPPARGRVRRPSTRWWREERPFLGYASAWMALERLAPLIQDGRVNEHGRAVLEGREEWEPRRERWIGGTRLPPGRAPWHWDPAAGRVAR